MKIYFHDPPTRALHFQWNNPLLVLSVRTLFDIKYFFNISLPVIIFFAYFCQFSPISKIFHTRIFLFLRMHEFNLKRKFFPADATVRSTLATLTQASIVPTAIVKYHRIWIDAVENLSFILNVVPYNKRQLIVLKR